MLSINLTKKQTGFVKSNPIDFLLVNWKILNDDVYLSNFNYDHDSNYITFDSYVGQNIWCFKLHLKEYLMLHSLDMYVDEEIQQIIEKFNSKYSIYDYSEFTSFMEKSDVSNYNIYDSVLIKYLNELNDSFVELDIVSDNESTLSDEVTNNLNSSAINVNLNGLNFIGTEKEFDLNITNNCNTNDDNNNEPKEINDETIDDIYGNENDLETLKINYKEIIYLDTNKIVYKSMDYIEKNKSNTINLNDKIQNFSDMSRVQMLINEINCINVKFENIKINPIDNNIFILSVVLSNFDNLDDIIMMITLDSNLYPYYPPKISFNINFEDNLEYFISSLDYFKVNFWNPTNSLEHTIVSVRNIINEHGKIIDKSFNDNNNEIFKLLNDLSIYSQIKPNLISQKDININFVSIYTNKKLDKIEYVGYGSNNRKKFNIKSYINSVELKYQMINNTLSMINKCELTLDQINKSCIIPLLIAYFKDIQLIDINKYQNVYHNLFLLLNNILKNHNNVVTNELLETIIECKNMLVDYKVINPELTKIESELYDIIIDINNNNNNNNNNNENNVNESDIRSQYIHFVKGNNYDIVDTFIKKLYLPLDSTPGKYCNNIGRISKEMISLRKNMPISWESSIFAKFNKEQMSLMKFVIIGPKDTPYENGFFEFHIKLGELYPTNNPSCHFQTTGSGRVRFNPNLYESGKVCLSLLGTWRGHESENWNADTSTLLQLLLSIQSLILCEQPYFNEPGWESSYGTPAGIASSNNYNCNIQKYTIMYAIIEQINNPPENFEQQVYGHFYFKKTEILECFEKWLQTNYEIKNLKQNLIDALDKAQNEYMKKYKI